MTTEAERIREAALSLAEQQNQLRASLPKFVIGGSETIAKMTIDGALQLSVDTTLSSEETEKFVEWVLRFFVRGR